jgi:hypothetical protein
MSLTLPLFAFAATLLAAPAQDTSDPEHQERCAAFGPDLLGRGEKRLEHAIGIPAQEKLRDGCADVVLQLAANGKVLRVDVCHVANEELQNLARQYANRAKFSEGDAEAVALKLCVDRKL